MNPIDEYTLNIVQPQFESLESSLEMLMYLIYLELNALRGYKDRREKKNKITKTISIITLFDYLIISVFVFEFTHFVAHTKSDTCLLVKHIAAKHLSAGI